MSFFSSPSSNRRINSGREKRTGNLLEVSARPNRDNRLQFRRKFWSVFKVLLVLGLVAGAVFGGRAMVNRFVWENPAYALADIRVSTDGLLTRAQVLELLEVWEGKNIFTVDVEKMKRDLDELPQVEKADVRRQLPDRLDIRITERQPVAWVAASAEVELGTGVSSLLVDGRGYVMRTRKILPEHLALPRIIGVVMEDVAPGQKLPTLEALSALELIKLCADDLRWQPRVVDVSKGYCLLVTDDRKARVTFGFDNVEGQLGRLKQLLDYVEPQNRDLQSVNLMLERNIPVVFAPPPPAPVQPAIDPKTGKPKPGAKVASGSVPQNSSTGVSGGVVQPPGASIPNPVVSLPAATPARNAPPVAAVAATKTGGASSEGSAARAPLKRGNEPEAASSKKPQAEPDRTLKLAKLNEPPAARHKELPEKPVRRKAERDDDDDEEEQTKRPAKAVRVGDTHPSAAPRPKPAPAGVPEPPPRAVPASAPASIPPTDSLRKLFKPNG
jgi:cell division protein FtsQ